jgi:UDP-N-acetylmuramate: L-alanyl-gamma-D-glutamyl-meso-diaminopimelate ligase
MVFGKHNVQNIQGAWKVCRKIGVDDKTFLKAISTFSGASKRLQLLNKTKDSAVYKDFAHSPSKLKATIEAIKELYPERELIACLELHTFSSLNKAFLPQYRGCMDLADMPVVYFSHHALALKRLPELTAEEVKGAFSDDRLNIYNDSAKMEEDLLGIDYHNKNLLLMSSGNFDGLDMEALAIKVLDK